jgi:hypothetical protein
MGAREFKTVRRAMPRIDPLAGGRLRPRSGSAWMPDLDREDPAAFRQRVEREARRARALNLRALLRKIFG